MPAICCDTLLEGPPIQKELIQGVRDLHYWIFKIEFMCSLLFLGILSKGRVGHKTEKQHGGNALIIPPQKMTGGTDDESKKLLNLSDCIDFCQVLKFAKRPKGKQGTTDPGYLVHILSKSFSYNSSK